MSDPYVELLRELAPKEVIPYDCGGGFLTGTVVTAGTEPLTVAAAGMVLSAGDLAVASSLKHSYPADKGEPELLRVGDVVCMGTGDYQFFYILCKAVDCV
ncbi:MAG: hypothetical protein RSB55_08160 [Oscillospiraceae bacterium]